MTFRTVQSSGESEAASARPRERRSPPRTTGSLPPPPPRVPPRTRSRSRARSLASPRARPRIRARACPPSTRPPRMPTPPGPGARGGSRGPADPRGVAGSPVTLESWGSPWTRVTWICWSGEKPSAARIPQRARRGSRSPEHRADSARERSPSPRRSPPFRRTPSTRSRPASSPTPGPRRARALPAALPASAASETTRMKSGTRSSPAHDAAGLSPEKRNPRPSGSGKHLGLSFSIFGTRRSRRRSEANPLQKMEQAKQEVCARGVRARAAGVRARPPRAAQSAGSAQELAALRRGDGRAASVSAFDGRLAAAGDGEPPRVKKEKTYGSDRGDPASSVRARARTSAGTRARVANPSSRVRR